MIVFLDLLLSGVIIEASLSSSPGFHLVFEKQFWKEQVGSISLASSSNALAFKCLP